MTEKTDLLNTVRTSCTFAFLTFKSLTLSKRNLLQKTEIYQRPRINGLLNFYLFSCDLYGVSHYLFIFSLYLSSYLSLASLHEHLKTHFILWQIMTHFILRLMRG